MKLSFRTHLAAFISGGVLVGLMVLLFQASTPGGAPEEASEGLLSAGARDLPPRPSAPSLVGGDFQSADSGQSRAPAATDEEKAEPELPDETKNTILSCTRGVESLRGVARASDFRTLDEYLERAVTPIGGTPIERHLQFRNLHVRSSKGEVLRLHVVPPGEDGEGDEGTELQLFGADADDLPVPLPLPLELKRYPWQEAIERFQSQGQVIFDEVSEAQRWDDQVGAQVLRRNGRVDELAIYLSDGALACSREATGSVPVCRCL